MEEIGKQLDAFLFEHAEVFGVALAHARVAIGGLQQVQQSRIILQRASTDVVLAALVADQADSGSAGNGFLSLHIAALVHELGQGVGGDQLVHCGVAIALHFLRLDAVAEVGRDGQVHRRRCRWG